MSGETLSVTFLYIVALHMPKRKLTCMCCYRRYRGGRTSTGVTRAFIAWQNMRARIRNKHCPIYKHYGGRGITICERWDDFDNFFEDMGHPPEGLSLDRIDNEGNYEPTNCQWATKLQQTLNRTCGHQILFEGTTLNILQWSRLLRMPVNRLRKRLNELSWPTEKALFT